MNINEFKKDLIELMKKHDIMWLGTDVIEDQHGVFSKDFVAYSNNEIYVIEEDNTGITN